MTQKGRSVEAYESWERERTERFMRILEGGPGLVSGGTDLYLGPEDGPAPPLQESGVPVRPHRPDPNISATANVKLSGEFVEADPE
jgi:hypothetical protein